MKFEYLKPLENALVSNLCKLPNLALGNCIALHTAEAGFPDLSNKKIAIVGIEERKAAANQNVAENGIDIIREELYKLFPGNWPVNVADLGNIYGGNTIKDTFFAVEELVGYLLKNEIIPIIIGGNQHITYVNYRAYDKLEQTVNLVAVDNKFDLGSIEEEISSQSYLSKIIMDEPNNLFNFSNIGYQTYFNSQAEIDLLDSLFFETQRLGEVKNAIQIVEPVLRDADIVSIDISAVKMNEAPGNNNPTPNGLSGSEICAIARYAGISDKVSSFGIYEFNATSDFKNQTSQLIAQMIWYFIEGVNYRANDYPFGLKDKYQKYIVPIENEVLNFYKSHKSGRWWMEITLNENNKFKRHALIPCTYQDYLNATNQEIPDRWLRTLKKLI